MRKNARNSARRNRIAAALAVSMLAMGTMTGCGGGDDGGDGYTPGQYSGGAGGDYTPGQYSDGYSFGPDYSSGGSSSGGSSSGGSSEGWYRAPAPAGDNNYVSDPRTGCSYNLGC